MSYLLSYIFGAPGGAGLSLEAIFRDAAGNSVGSAITTGFVDLGGGDYQAVIAHPDGHVGCVEFRLAGGGARQALASVNPQEGENLDTKISVLHGLLGRHTATSDMVYSGPNLTSYTVRSYDTAANALANDGSTGLLLRYEVVNTFLGTNLATSIMTLVS